MTDSVFITGGAGFIGARLAERLLDQGASVTIYDNLHSQVESIARPNAARLAARGARVIEADVRDAERLSGAIAEASAGLVYHLAAETGTGQSYDLPASYAEVNVTGTARLIEAIRACSSVRRVILAGSRAVYGEGACVDAQGRLTPAVARRAEDLAAGDYAPKDRLGNRLTPVATTAETCPVAPASIYASTKLMQEYLLEQAFWGSRVGVGLLRLQNVYGPGQACDNPYTGVLSIFARQIAEGRVLEIYEDGAITRDFVHVEDVTEAFLRIGTVTELPQGPVDIGSGRGATILETARLMLGLMGRDPDRLRITGQFRPGDIRHACADLRRAVEALGWSPRHDLREGLAVSSNYLDSKIRFPDKVALGRVDKRDSSGSRPMIQAHLYVGDELGTQPDIRR